MKIKIIVAAHKKYFFPEEAIYLPVQAGSALNPPLGFQRDDEGNNISSENPNFCELTCLYWAWKNLQADYYGLCHYRRYFSGKSSGPKFERIADQEKISGILRKVPLILPRPRNYWIESNYQQYIHAHHQEDLMVTRKVISELCSDYLEAYDQVMEREYGSRFNMFIMRKDIFHNYCECLFKILFEVKKQQIRRILYEKRNLDLGKCRAAKGRIRGFCRYVYME